MSCRPLVYALARKGVPTREIAALAGVGVKRVRFLRAEFGLSAPRWGRPVDTDELARLSALGLGARRIARALGHHLSTIQRARDRIGLPALPWPPVRSRAPAIRVPHPLAALAWDKAEHVSRVLARRWPSYTLDELLSHAAAHVDDALRAMPGDVRNPDAWLYRALILHVGHELDRDERWRARLAPRSSDPASRPIRARARSRGTLV